MIPPTLAQTLMLSGPKGMCFHRSAALCYDLPGSQLVIGTFRAATEEERKAIPEASDVPFLHAWVEHKGKVLAPTSIEHFGTLVAMERFGYYKINGAKNLRRISRSKLLEIFRAEPELLIQLTTGVRPKRKGLLVDTLLAAAKVSFKVTPDGGVVPL